MFSHQPPMWVPSDYHALQTDRPTWTPTNDPKTPFYQTGVVYYRSEVRPAQIVDGLGKTYLCGEKFLAAEFYDDVNGSDAVGMMGDNQSAWAGYEWDNHRVAWNPTSEWPQDAYQPRRDNSDTGLPGIFAFGSAHPGSLNMAFCDGSVRPVDYDIDWQTHRRSANRLDEGN